MSPAAKRKTGAAKALTAVAPDNPRRLHVEIDGDAAILRLAAGLHPDTEPVADGARGADRRAATGAGADIEAVDAERAAQALEGIIAAARELRRRLGEHQRLEGRQAA